MALNKANGLHIIRLPVRIALCAAAVIALFFAFRATTQDLAAVFEFESYFMALVCGLLLAFFLVIFILRGIGFRAGFVLLIAYLSLILASNVSGWIGDIEHYLATGDLLFTNLNAEKIAGFDEAALQGVCAHAREMVAALWAFLAISFAALFVPRGKTAVENEDDVWSLPKISKVLWVSAVYGCICGALYIFGSNIYMDTSSSKLAGIVFAIPRSLGFGHTSLALVGLVLFALPFIWKEFVIMLGAFGIAGAMPETVYNVPRITATAAQAPGPEPAAEVFSGYASLFSDSVLCAMSIWLAAFSLRS